MDYSKLVDHDLHIHTYLSGCSDDPEQNPERILRYAEENGMRHICTADHYWDEAVSEPWLPYIDHGNERQARILPLPQSENVTFHFGCETELSKDMVLGIHPDNYDKFDFIIIPTTHLHFIPFTVDPKDSSTERRAELYLSRLDGVLDMDLPFHKVGIAHLACNLLAPGVNYPASVDHEEHIRVLDLISEDSYREVYSKMAKRGVGFEINFCYFGYYSDENLQKVLRIHRIAKECGCKFYFGSDAHHPARLISAPKDFVAIAEALDLHEENMFRPFD